MNINDLKVLFEDEYITVCIKPQGIASEDSPNEKGIIGLLSERAGQNLHLLHRLDRNVSGVMVFANNKQSAAALSKAIAEGDFKKEYLTVCDGFPQEDKGVFEDLLFKDSRKNRSYVVKRVRKGVKDASLEYEVLQKSDNKAMVRVLLHTGRTHQIRVQFASRQLCLTGDIKYGSKDRTNCRIALHSHRITFAHPKTGEQMQFESNPDISEYPWNLFNKEGA
ncbi:MAG: RluA family pseudouridine synthase [Clostridia bacterium]|nr:RluA family pseudouridine synthase [Clostridia bacterium]